MWPGGGGGRPPPPPQLRAPPRTLVCTFILFLPWSICLLPPPPHRAAMESRVCRSWTLSEPCASCFALTGRNAMTRDDRRCCTRRRHWKGEQRARSVSDPRERAPSPFTANDSRGGEFICARGLSLVSRYLPIICFECALARIGSNIDETKEYAGAVCSGSFPVGASQCGPGGRQRISSGSGRGTR